MTQKRILKQISKAAIFTAVYTLIFFSLTNLEYWYFNQQFLYHELITDAGYYMYDWVGNALATLVMATVAFILEMIRFFMPRPTLPE